MSEEKEPFDIEAAFIAAMASRKETFLARLPRFIKVLGLVLLLSGVIVTPLFIAKTPFVVEDAAHQAEQAEPLKENLASISAEQTPPAHEDRTAHEQSQMEKETQAKTVIKPDHSLEETEAVSPPCPPVPDAEKLVIRQPETDVQKKAVSRNDREDLSDEMPVAPDPALIEETAGGYLPRMASDGRSPWKVYSRPFDRLDPRPRIVIVMMDMGLSTIATDAALRRLPQSITFAFDAQSEALGAWLKRARQDGHETLLSLPMEPLDFPRSDPGPNALLTSLPSADNIDRFRGFLKKGVGYVGLTTMTGSRFVADAEKLRPVLEEVASRGLMVLDGRIAAHGVLKDLAKQLKVPVAISYSFLDADPSPYAIEKALKDLEQAARRDGQVVAMATPLPVTLDRIEDWAKGLAAKGLVLAPVSAAVE